LHRLLRFLCVILAAKIGVILAVSETTILLLQSHAIKAF
jgi:hypothetical protein